MKRSFAPDGQEKQNILIVKLDQVSSSGLMAFLSPYGLQTLIALCTFADEKGRLKVSAKKLAQALDLSEKQAAIRLKRLCNVRWQGRALLVKEEGEAFTLNRYRLVLPDGLMMRRPEALPARQAGDFRQKSTCTEAEKENNVPPNLPIEGSEEEAKEGSSLPEAEVPGNTYNMLASNVVVKNIYNNKTTTPDKHELVKRLKDQGVTLSTASWLVERYPEQQITDQLEMLPFRKAQNPAGMLIKAIKENWVPPKGYKEAQEQKAIKQAENESQAKELARKRARQQKIAEIKAKMSKQELDELRQRAKQKLARVLHKVYSDDNLPETLVDVEIDYIIASKYLQTPAKF